MAAQPTEALMTTTVITPNYRRSFAMSVLITFAGIFALFLIATSAGAGDLETNSGGDMYGEGLLEIIDYVGGQLQFDMVEMTES